MAEEQVYKKDKKTYSYNLEKPSLGRVFFARLLDLLISSIPGFIMIFATPLQAQDLKSGIIVLITSIFIIFFYFTILPFLLKGNTIGKLICNLRIVKKDKNKISFWNCFVREFYFLYIAYIIQIIFQIIAIIVFVSISNPEQEENSAAFKTALIIKNMGWVFLGFWFFYIPLTIYLQENHISSVDLKLGIEVKQKVLKIEIEDQVIIKKDYKKHVHLNENKPGDFDLEVLEKIGEKNNE